MRIWDHLLGKGQRVHSAACTRSLPEAHFTFGVCGHARLELRVGPDALVEAQLVPIRTQALYYCRVLADHPPDDLRDRIQLYFASIARVVIVYFVSEEGYFFREF